MKPLVLCADDFAVHPGASRGIAELAAMGRLSATSVMVLSPHWLNDAALLADLRGRIDVGLHLDWTSPFAVAAGYGMSLGRAMLRAALGGFDRAMARQVIERQLDAFEAQWKAPPDHVDGHQHVQQFAGIREALVETLARRYPVVRPYLRVSRVPASDGFKGRVITAMGADALKTIANNALIPGTPALFGIYDFGGDAPGYAARMQHWLVDCPAGAVLMCHPAQEAPGDDDIGPARVREFSYLRSGAFGDALARAQVQLARGATLYTAAP